MFCKQLRRLGAAEMAFLAVAACMLGALTAIFS
jgi:hypothetical protein